MRYIRQYVQQTVQAESSSEFDELVNAIYRKAALSGKDPEIHFFEGRGFCATSILCQPIFQRALARSMRWKEWVECAVIVRYILHRKTNGLDTQDVCIAHSK